MTKSSKRSGTLSTHFRKNSIRISPALCSIIFFNYWFLQYFCNTASQSFAKNWHHNFSLPILPSLVSNDERDHVTIFSFLFFFSSINSMWNLAPKITVISNTKASPEVLLTLADQQILTNIFEYSEKAFTFKSGSLM
jgi:hypothetical protein